MDDNIFEQLVIVGLLLCFGALIIGGVLGLVSAIMEIVK
jgi:hypothetical protein